LPEEIRDLKEYLQFWVLFLVHFLGVFGRFESSFCQLLNLEIKLRKIKIVWTKGAGGDKRTSLQHFGKLVCVFVRNIIGNLRVLAFEERPYLERSNIQKECRVLFLAPFFSTAHKRSSLLDKGSTL